jgi:hypothetical protein
MSEDNSMGLSIWFLCGLILGVYGLAVTVSGIMNVFNPPKIFGAELHLDLVWGLVLLISGLTFMYFQRPCKVRKQD